MSRSERPSLLILGGTRFVGPALVEAAEAAGWKVTLFHRGRDMERFARLEQRIGDRNTDLSALKEGRWDAVVDTCGYFPRQVRASAEALKDRVGRYVFISSISVYSDLSQPGGDESNPLARIADPTVETITGETYGALKVLCEETAEAVMGDRALSIRPGLIVGPDDPTDRFTYWPVRLARGGEVLAPGEPSDPVQWIDVRDLAAWTVKAIQQDLSGPYNANGPNGPSETEVGIGALIEACRAHSSVPSTVTWLPAAVLEEEGVAAWSDMPVWIPPIGEYAGHNRVSSARAYERGLRFRSVDVTVADTLAWWDRLPEARRATLKSGISPERERDVLARRAPQGTFRTPADHV